MKVNIEKLNWLRIERGLSITKLAEKAGMSKATVSRLLRNEVTTRPDTVGKIAKTLKVDVKDLFIND